MSPEGAFHLSLCPSAVLLMAVALRVVTSHANWGVLQPGFQQSSVFPVIAVVFFGNLWGPEKTLICTF